MTVFSLAYFSRSRVAHDPLARIAAIEDILAASRVRNSMADVTGALLFNEGRFAQVLEGPEGKVREIYASIERDPRHTEVTILSLQHGKARRFGSWSMAYVGRSEQSRKLFQAFAAEGALHPIRLSADGLCRVMLQMIAIDRRV